MRKLTVEQIFAPSRWRLFLEWLFPRLKLKRKAQYLRDMHEIQTRHDRWIGDEL